MKARHKCQETFHLALTPSPEENQSAERMYYLIFQRPTSSASSISSEEVTISVEHQPLSHEAEKHLGDSVGRG